MYVLNIHNMPKIFWGAWPLIIFERPKCSKVLVPLSKLSVSKNVWFTNARLGPLDFIHSEMLKRGMGGVRPVWKTASGDYYFRGWTPPRSNTRGIRDLETIYDHFLVWLYITYTGVATIIGRKSRSTTVRLFTVRTLLFHNSCFLSTLGKLTFNLLLTFLSFYNSCLCSIIEFSPIFPTCTNSVL